MNNFWDFALDQGMRAFEWGMLSGGDRAGVGGELIDAMNCSAMKQGGNLY
jgi:hypothetical protein